MPIGWPGRSSPPSGPPGDHVPPLRIAQPPGDRIELAIKLRHQQLLGSQCSCHGDQQRRQGDQRRHPDDELPPERARPSVAVRGSECVPAYAVRRA